MSGFAAMKFVGIDREYFRSLSIVERAKAWMMIVMTIELTKEQIKA